MRFRVAGAVGLPLVWNNVVLPRLRFDHRGRTVANALAATGYALVFAGTPRWISARGLRYGIGCAGIVAAGFAVASAAPSLRRALSAPRDRAPATSTVEWVAVQIPLGTVYTEELIFRATLEPLLDREFGDRAGRLLGAAVFGLWHIHPARAAGDSVPATVVFTGAAGLLFGALYRHTGSAAAPALLHWAVNAGGALVPRLLRGNRTMN
ncbi:CPBP family intramembrane glutamic endopeptidase [Nocardia sp. NPDC004568]|uniref:CPBP family intramembrane glutamic endopeptidase n=1 Tax=Nocardia sp. NPDC004568 TaxID=3154551 RepID=UPI0033A71B6E